MRAVTSIFGNCRLSARPGTPQQMSFQLSQMFSTVCVCSSRQQACTALANNLNWEDSDDGGAGSGGCPIFLHLELGACAVLARACARTFWLTMAFAHSHHIKTSTITSIFEPLRQPCAVLARSLRAQGFWQIILYLGFVDSNL